MVSSMENESRKRLRQEPVEDGTPENLKPLETKKARTEENDKDEIRLKLKDIQNELSCPICTEWFLRTTTLGCGHSFCGDCIDRWLHTNLSCPLCRAPLREPPIHSHVLDRAIEIVIRRNDELKKRFDERLRASEEILKEAHKKKELLDKAVSNTKKNGLRLVRVFNLWSSKETDRFLGGVRQYQGLPRLTYCNIVSLSMELVGRLSEHDLAIVGFNLNLDKIQNPVPNESKDPRRLRYYQQWAKVDIGSLRDRIYMFIQYG